MRNTAPLTVVEGDADRSRKPGRPKGLPKSGGRKPGVKNRISADVKQSIIVDGKPLETLYAIARGNRLKAADPSDPTKKTFVYPSLSDRRSAAESLLRKVVPDLKHQEIASDPEKPLFPAAGDSSFEVGRRLAFLLAKGAEGLPAEPKPRRSSEDDVASRDFAAACFVPTRAADETQNTPRESLESRAAQVAHDSGTTPATDDQIAPETPVESFEANPPVIGTRTLGQTYEISKGVELIYQGLNVDGSEIWHAVLNGTTKSVHEGPASLDNAVAAARRLQSGDTSYGR